MKAFALAACVAAFVASPSTAARLEVGVAFYGGALYTASTDDGYVPGTIGGTQFVSGSLASDTYRVASAAAVATYGALGVAAATRSTLNHRESNFNDYAAGFARSSDTFRVLGASPTSTLSLRFVVDIAQSHTDPDNFGKNWEVSRTGIKYTDVHDDYGNQTYAVLGLFMNSNTALACYRAPGNYDGFSPQCQNSLFHIGHNDITVNVVVPTNQAVGLTFTLLADTRQFRPANGYQGAYGNGTIDAGIFALGTAHIYASTPDPMTSFTAESGYSYLAPAGVPEPAAWALLIGGFGLTGIGMRHRRRGRAPERHAA